ncbi:MAG: hypothetical protein U0Q11_05125 [Vicinamibacterales bacterium]
MSHSSHSTNHALPTGTVEPDAVDTAAIYKFGIGLTVITIISHLAMYWIYVATYVNPQPEGQRLYPLAAATQESRRPPQPRLQDGVVTDNGGRLLPEEETKDHNPGVREALRLLRAEEDRVLTGYAWVDHNNQIVRIPVADAMKLTLQRGLPSRTQTAAEAPAAAAPATQEKK